MSAERWQRLFPSAELAVGQMRAVAIGDEEVLVCRTGAGLFALDNTCTHACARMVEGRLDGDRLRCPMHGAAFDVRSGAVLKGPATLALRSHAVRIVAGMVEVALAPDR